MAMNSGLPATLYLLGKIVNSSPALSYKNRWVIAANLQQGVHIT
ncbi:uncharacterized protein KNN_06973 (plasmid) [Bacillus thuringiensis serovar tolworthi]|uniref:Uncharacterized protein n=1 Tax=Bacillus thuringiensis subsp. tolworthi TaxID=1442 RepID=A0A9W4AIK6_BACTO|nr:MULTISPECIES: hypothetical protein [Bacillus cereus group]MEB9482887.1 hypothetical protein [Bacillus cereus]MEB9595764.1 hypothetical protein [Bacillus cereus]BAR87706.1 uncharacterized protein KNN_06973 [Bacillus thuringiensis serovar tolworthi]